MILRAFHAEQVALKGFGGWDHPAADGSYSKTAQGRPTDEEMSRVGAQKPGR